MTSLDHKTLTSITQMPNYNRWIISQFKPFFGKSTLEMGSGIGNLTKYFPQTTTPILTDVSPRYIKYLNKYFSHPVFKYDFQKSPPQKLRSQKFNTVFSSNVLEHIKDDKKALRYTYDLLKDKGKLLLFVPACNSIYGPLDKELKHFRRYDKKNLEKLLRDTGYKINIIRYHNFIGFFTWFISGKLLRQSVIKPLPAKIFDLIFTPLLYLEKYISLPIGQSLLVVAEKKT